MGSIDNVVQVTISRQTAVPSVAAFNDILIVDEFLMSSTTPVFTASERVRTYGSLTELTAGGFGTSSFVYKAAAAALAQNPSVSKIKVGRKKTGVDGTETWDAAMAAIKAANNDWYGLVISTRTLADQQLVATWVEANAKLCVLASGDTNCVDAASGDIGAYVKNASMARTAVVYHLAASLANEPIDAAWFGKLFPKDPGTATWAFKTLAGITVDNLTAAQLTQAKSKNLNCYIPIAGTNMTNEGKVGSGEYLDVIHGIDWLQATIQQYVFTPMANLDKIPYTDAGVQVIVGQLRAALDKGVKAGLLASYTVDYPLVADVAAADKGTRTLPDVAFTAVLAGAIHATVIKGIVTL